MLKPSFDFVFTVPGDPFGVNTILYYATQPPNNSPSGGGEDGGGTFNTATLLYRQAIPGQQMEPVFFRWVPATAAAATDAKNEKEEGWLDGIQRRVRGFF